MESKIQKWGNSLAVRIPKVFAEEAGLEENCKVDMSFIDGRIVINSKSKFKFDLDDLLVQVTPENIHSEIDTGSEVGSEIQ